MASVRRVFTHSQTTLSLRVMANISDAFRNIFSEMGFEVNASLCHSLSALKWFPTKVFDDSSEIRTIENTISIFANTSNDCLNDLWFP